ncbi:MAG: thiol oxidoreductase [Pseudomonadota bacterium]|nr:thiol oxidoreductase [Pseudomonadota bacterium]
MESRTIRYGLTGFAALLLAFGGSASSQAQPAQDPGPRGGDAGAGDKFPGLPDPLQKLFDAGRDEFMKQDKVKDDQTSNNGGLGPRMNLDSCLSCHFNPGPGGSSPGDNPQFAFFNAPPPRGVNHSTNKLPSFITVNGPTREARFKQIRDPSNGAPVGPDGGVHDLFTIAGMQDATGCKLEQPDFEEELRHNNVIFRIPTPVFGAGLIEQIPDKAIIDNINNPKDADQKKALGISRKVNVVVSGGTITAQNTKIEQPKPNKNGNDGTIARFGWKAQDKSLLIFSGEAYNVEMGISNELFQTEREEASNCQFKPTPNDATDPSHITEMDPVKRLDILSDIEKFASFMRLLAPPVPSSDIPGGSGSIAKGNTLFSEVGCALCHTPTLHTVKFADPQLCEKSAIPQLCDKDVNLFSDLALHHMGAKLDDGITQGQAERDEFRTAPLWGLGKRIFFLHDGRTRDLVQAIEEHHSLSTINFRCRLLSFFGLSQLCRPEDGTIASEANAIVDKYNKLPDTDPSSPSKQDLLNFLRSL